MVDAEPNVSEDDSLEMKTLEERHPLQNAADADRGMLNIPSSPSLESAKSILQNDFTVATPSYKHHSTPLISRLDLGLR